MLREGVFFSTDLKNIPLFDTVIACYSFYIGLGFAKYVLHVHQPSTSAPTKKKKKIFQSASCFKRILYGATYDARCAALCMTPLTFDCGFRGTTMGISPNEVFVHRFVSMIACCCAHVLLEVLRNPANDRQGIFLMHIQFRTGQIHGCLYSVGNSRTSARIT